MYLSRYFVMFACLLLVSCRSKTSLVELEPTPTPQGPSVISNNPNAVIKSWEYISPRSEDALTSFPVRNSDAIGFGPDAYEAYIVWHEGGFDLIWGNFSCSTQPILIVEETTITLWLNDGIWDDCVAAEVIHAFKVKMETDIPIEEWAYILHQDAPPLS